jgi:hypothetical protein
MDPMDPIEKAKSQMGPLTKKLTGLPGIAAYREKEMRRDSDKLVRDRLVQELETRRTRINGLQEQVLAAGGLLLMDDMEQVTGRLQLLIDRVRTAAYGYAGFYDLERVLEPQLEALIKYDQALFDSLPALDSSIDGLDKAVQANDGIPAALQAVTAAVTDLSDKFGRRMEAITNA